jgi:hypothetical protein
MILLSGSENSRKKIIKKNCCFCGNENGQCKCIHAVYAKENMFFLRFAKEPVFCIFSGIFKSSNP